MKEMLLADVIELIENLNHFKLAIEALDEKNKSFFDYKIGILDTDIKLLNNKVKPPKK